MLFITIAAAISAFEVFNIVSKFGDKALAIMLGYDVYLEILFSVILTGIAATTGTISGVIIAVVTGFFLTIALHITKHTYGYAKFERVLDPSTVGLSNTNKKKIKLVEYTGTSLGEYVRRILDTSIRGVSGFVNNFVGHKIC